MWSMVALTGTGHYLFSLVFTTHLDAHEAVIRYMEETEQPATVTPGVITRDEWNSAVDGVLDAYYEPDLDAQFEHDSQMESIGWGTDEDYGYYGEDY